MDNRSFFFISDLVVYSSYITIAIRVVGAVLMFAAIVMKPRGMEKISYWERLKISFVVHPQEKELFPDIHKKIKTNRLLWRIVLGLLVLRGVIALGTLALVGA